MTRLFSIEGNNLDLGYVNVRDMEGPTEQRLHEQVEDLWRIYEPYADRDFRQGFARDFDGRFWEMYLGCALLGAGKELLPTAARSRQGKQPDLCVIDGPRRVWIEAIAPTEGEPGPDQLVRPIPLNEGGGLYAAPLREGQLRITSAFLKKARIIAGYLQHGVIGSDDCRIIAISGSRFGAYLPEQPLPLVMTALFPFGDQFVTIDRETGQTLQEGFHHSPDIRREGENVPRTAFLDERFADISGVIWSRNSIGNMCRRERPITFVHNPLARVPLPPRWGVWDREFVTRKEDGGGATTQDILEADSQAG